MSSLGCTPDDDSQQPPSDPQFIWAGKYESHVKLFKYCDGVTSPATDEGTLEVIIGDKPSPYILYGGYYGTIITNETNLFVAEDRTDIKEDPIDKSAFYLVFRNTLTKKPPLFEHSILNVVSRPPEPGLEDIPYVCKIAGGNVFIGKLVQIDNENRSCKELDPPCPRSLQDLP